ncbi:DUF6318 family protein [Janibacter sp. CX7]|uniref:DUF6318 family protein n=1 Tax=Janibacter sp. CX7 TaxID=2963431 RepID=UPI0020CD7DAA|nr:DUF6318 family protein [Janibacter sp. CX7]UTT67284.1 DUF6318 family protein [Janibacter sp. CX7]
MAVLTGGLAACGDDSEPEESTTTASPIDASKSSSTSSDSSSSSESSSEPSTSSDDPSLPDDMPAEAREETKEGAAAFGEYFLLAYGDAAKSADTTVFQTLGASDCSVCATAIKNIEADKAKGWKKDKNPYTVRRAVATKRPDEGYKVVLDVTVASHHRIDSKGVSNGDVNATSYTVTEHVSWADGRWQVKDWIVT